MNRQPWNLTALLIALLIGCARDCSTGRDSRRNHGRGGRKGRRQRIDTVGVARLWAGYPLQRLWL